MATKYSYDNYVTVLATKALSRLEEIEGVYGFEFGSEFEIAICEILRELLPSKYGICRGFVVDYEGNKAGDDIIIFDQDRFPTLKLKGKAQFLRKESIPVEAVYAYIEAKHNIILNDVDSNSSINKALEQVKSVKRLLLKRKKENLKVNSSIELLRPNYSNPPFTIIWTRNVSLKNSLSHLDNPNDVNEALSKSFTINSECDLFPDCMILGKSNFYCTSIKKNESQHFNIFNLASHNTTFKYGKYDIVGLAVGFGLAFLMAALDQIELGTMPWINIINDIVNNKKQC